MFSLKKHLKLLLSILTQNASLPPLKSLEDESLAGRTNILTEDFLSFLLPLKF